LASLEANRMPFCSRQAVHHVQSIHTCQLCHIITSIVSHVCTSRPRTRTRTRTCICTLFSAHAHSFTQTYAHVQAHTYPQTHPHTRMIHARTRKHPKAIDIDCDVRNPPIPTVIRKAHHSTVCPDAALATRHLWHHKGHVTARWRRFAKSLALLKRQATLHR
jgi:hypothetical protein